MKNFYQSIFVTPWNRMDTDERIVVTVKYILAAAVMFSIPYFTVVEMW
jgi:hypothetical protein